jgi:hypothetical protein
MDIVLELCCVLCLCILKDAQYRRRKAFVLSAESRGSGLFLRRRAIVKGFDNWSVVFAMLLSAQGGVSPTQHFRLQSCLAREEQALYSG